MVFKSFSISLRLLSLVATMTFGSRAFAVEPTPPVSLSKIFVGTKYGYTLQVTQATAAAGTAWVHDGKMYVQEGKEYTFRLTVTEADKWYIGIQPTQEDGSTLDYDKRNGSQSGAGPNSTYIDVKKTFNTSGTHVIAKAFYYEGESFSRLRMATVDIEVTALKVELIPTSPRGVIYDNWRPVSWSFKISSGISVPLPYLSYYLNNNDPDPIIKEITDSTPQTVPRLDGGDTFLVQHDRGSYSGTALVSGKVLCDSDTKLIAIVPSADDYLYDYEPLPESNSGASTIMRQVRVTIVVGTTFEKAYTVIGKWGYEIGGEGGISFEKLGLPLDLKFKGSYHYSEETQDSSKIIVEYVDWDGEMGHDSNGPDETNEAHDYEITFYNTAKYFLAKKYIKLPDGTKGAFVETAPMTLWEESIKTEWK